MTWAKMVIGSNICLNTPGVILWDAGDGTPVLPLIALERREDRQLLVSVDVFTEKAEHAAKLRRNAWAFEQDRYTVTTAPESLTLTDDVSGALVLEVRVTGPNDVEINQGDLWTPGGATHIAIRPDSLVIGGATLIGNSVAGGAAIILGPYSLGMGGQTPPNMQDWLEG